VDRRCSEPEEAANVCSDKKHRIASCRARLAGAAPLSGRPSLPFPYSWRPQRRTCLHLAMATAHGRAAARFRTPEAKGPAE
jgi:hypothetical protein